MSRLLSAIRRPGGDAVSGAHKTWGAPHSKLQQGQITRTMAREIAPWFRRRTPALLRSGQVRPEVAAVRCELTIIY
jgi:hypothetical protein